jgi:hypothetical protein
MKKVLLGLTAALMLGSAQADVNTGRLAKCIKNLRNMETTLQSTQQDLFQCQSMSTPGGNNRPQIKRLKRELRQTREELRMCRLTSTPTPDFGETARLRRELQQSKQDLRLAQSDNQFLRDSNNNLRDRLDQCEGSSLPTGNNFCTASCKTSSGAPNLSYLGSGEAQFEIQAQNMAVQDVRSKYNCSYGIVNVECSVQGYEPAKYCIAGCKTSGGNVNLSYTKGASGKSETEAKFNALKEVKKSYNCSYGMKVSHCN